MTQTFRLEDLYDASRTQWTGFVEDGKWAGEWVLIDRLSQHARRAYESEFHVSFFAPPSTMQGSDVSSDSDEEYFALNEEALVDSLRHSRIVWVEPSRALAEMRNQGFDDEDERLGLLGGWRFLGMRLGSRIRPDKRTSREI